MRWRDIPLGVFIAAIAGLAMMVPVGFAAFTGEWQAARTFFYFSLATLIVSTIFALARMNQRAHASSIRHLFVLLGAYLVLPAVTALPLWVLEPTLTPVVAYFEMLSALTTTGFTVFDRAGDLSPTLHLWKALVAWLGGYMIVIAAVAIMAPLRIGGYEIRTLVAGNAGQALLNQSQIDEGTERLIRAVGHITPIYAGVTVLIWLAMLGTGKPGLDAFCLALSIVSTSGLTPMDGAVSGQGGWPVEMIVLVGMIVASTSLFFDSTRPARVHTVVRDPELKVLALFATLLPLALFLRHWVGALEVETQSSIGLALEALWGSVFTVVSFVTTSGFESAYWASAQTWSGLPTPGLILMALATVGGGAASTAGGIKLLRVYALYKQGVREIERLVMPSSVAGAGTVARSIRREGAFIAWLFLMLFLLSLALSMLALALAGQSFEDALQLSIAALSNIGPGYTLMAEDPIRIRDLDPAAHVILCVVMVLGRLEALAVIALVNPAFWRR